VKRHQHHAGQGAREPLLAAAAAIRETVMASDVVCSDETSARVTGRTWWEWVFVGTLAALHIIRPCRGKALVQALFGAIRPAVWVSDMPAWPRKRMAGVPSASAA
jgi:transposase